MEVACSYGVDQFVLQNFTTHVAKAASVAGVHQTVSACSWNWREVGAELVLTILPLVNSEIAPDWKMCNSLVCVVISQTARSGGICCRRLMSRCLGYL